MSASGDAFLDVSRRFLDLLGPDGLGSEWEQHDFAIGGREPRWVLLPSSVDECSAAMRLCSEHSLAVVPAGFGRRLQQGHPPKRFDVVLSLSRLNRIVDHAAADLTLVTEAGTSLADVNARLAERGQWLPFDVPFSATTSIGGLIAANVSGPARQAFGAVRESLIGIRAVLADGTVVKSGGRVVKNVAGYDLHRLFVGSFGTLGIVVEASFKCQPRSEESAVAWFTGELGTLSALAARLAASTLVPQFIELFFGSKTAPRLALGLESRTEPIASALARARELAASAGIGSGSGGEDVHETIEALVTVDRPEVLVLRVGMPPAALAPFLDDALECCGREGARMHGHAHAGVGVARVRVEEAGADRGTAIVESLRRDAAVHGGYLVVESAPSDARLDVWGPPGASSSLAQGIKEAFDPKGILSPGRFVGGI